MLSWIDTLFATMFFAFRQPMESFIRLETADDETTFAAVDGSLVSVIKIDGSRQMIGPEEYQRIVMQSTIKTGARFERPGYALQVYFMRNPDRIQQELENLLAPNRQAAHAIGLEMDDLLGERTRVLSRYLSWEDCYFVLWTRSATLSKSEAHRSMSDRKANEWVIAEDAQYPYAGLEALRTRHRSYVGGMVQTLGELGIQSQLMEVHDALKAIRASIYPARSADRWRACLPGDPVPPRLQKNDNDASELLWPPIRRQVCTGDAEVLGPSLVRIGNLLWSGIDMTLAPMDPMPFSKLLDRLSENKVPFRISFLIESAGMTGVSTKKMMASILGFSNGVNKQIKRSFDFLEEVARDEPVVRLRVSLATWASADDRRLAEDRASMLVQAVESWGFCQVTQLQGDPLEAVMSSALGIACASTAPAAIAPLIEVMRLLPWERPSSPFASGAMLFRTDDGKVWPYQTGSPLTTTWFDLIFAQPGAGKSVLMNALNLCTCLTAGMSRLPFVAIIDIGPSSSGLISLLRDALPADRRHEAVHSRLSMRPEYAINPFDTQLGCRYPLPNERSYLVELITLLCTPPGQSAPYDGIPQLAGLVVDEMFRWRDDDAANAEPRPYLPNVVAEIDQAIRSFNLKLPEEPYWWDVVDAFHEVGQHHLAASAQRYASPILTDAVTAAQRPQIRSLLAETKISGGAEGVIHAFERMIASAIREIPIISGVTQFDISSARVCALDLQDVCPQGDDNSDRQTAIMYMLARHALVRAWWLNEEALRSIPQKFRPFHEARIKEIRETPKRLSFDEFHRTSKSMSVRAQVVRDVREGRKWGVQIVLSSQLLDDFGPEMIDLATGVWVLGAAVSEKAVTSTVDRFGLTDTARWIMRNRLTGPRSSGAPALLVLGTNEGRYEQFVINTLGPIELWALSTSAEDVAIRNRLYTRLGAARARRMLAIGYPGGSARSEIRRRISDLTEKGEVEEAAQGRIVEQIVNELVEEATRMQREEAERAEAAE